MIPPIAYVSGGVTVALAVLLAVTVWRWRRAPQDALWGLFATVVGLVTWWSLVATGKFASTTLTQKVLLYRLEMVTWVGLPVVTGMALIVGYHLTATSARAPLRWLVGILGGLVVLSITLPQAVLFPTPRLVPVGASVTLEHDLSLTVSVFTGIAWALFAVGAALVVLRWRRGGSVAPVVVAVTAIPFVPLIVASLKLADVVPAGGEGFNLAPVATGVTVLAVGTYLHRRGVATVLPDSRHLALERAREGYLLVGPDDRIRDINPVGSELTALRVGMTLPGWLAAAADPGVETCESPRGRQLAVECDPVDTAGGPTVWLLRDVTARHRRLQTLASRDRLIAGLPVGVFRASTDGTARITYANERFAEMVGYPDAAAVLEVPAASVVGDPELLVVPADTGAEPEPVEVRIDPVDSPPFWALVAVYPSPAAAESAVEGVIVDIGATKRAERLLAEALEATRSDLAVTERLWELSVTTAGYEAFAEAALGVLTAGPTVTWAGLVRPARTDGVDPVATVGDSAPPDEAVAALLSAVYADEASVRQPQPADSGGMLMGTPVWAEGLLEAVLVTALPGEPSADTTALVGDVAGALGYKRTVDLRERLPSTEQFTEVEVQVRDGAHPLSALLAAASADRSITCTPTRADGETMWYLTDATDALAAAATDAVTVEPRGAALRLGVPTGALHRRLGLEGAQVTALVVSASSATCTLQVRSDAAVAAIVATVRARFPTAQLRARRQVTPEPVSPRLLAPVDDAQRQALETATRLGFFARPQGATAEDVAAALGTSRSTLMRRLRGAEERVFEHLFGDED